MPNMGKVGDAVAEYQAKELGARAVVAQIAAVSAEPNSLLVPVLSFLSPRLSLPLVHPLNPLFSQNPPK